MEPELSLPPELDATLWKPAGDHFDDQLRELIIDVNLDQIFMCAVHGCPKSCNDDGYCDVHAPNAGLCQNASCNQVASVAQEFGRFCQRHAVAFPCGFPRCREKAAHSSSMCAKHASQAPSMRRELASRSQNARMCRTEGCYKVRQGRGYCTAHEKLLIATGRLEIKKREVDIAFTMCCFPACKKHAQRNRFCCKHGKELSEQARAAVDEGLTAQTYEEVLEVLQKTLRRCQHAGCQKNARYNQLCTMHYHLYNRGGDADDSEVSALPAIDQQLAFGM
ncbi:hypothetical protein ACHHYP_14604 [Achlya hypogyna]|uniref:Uncharacterized protein n=1 Tax=Achlya hypogyna TaxID=1202772 RepID=A0A1V9YCV5_ACHHY|nr:hypothetical protein ACHHYP_14604 [Achlya hypogyna]